MTDAPTVADLDPDASVHVRSHRGGAQSRVVHTDADCHQLAAATHTRTLTASRLHGDIPICRDFAGIADRGSSPGEDPQATRKALLEMDADDLIADGGVESPEILDVVSAPDGTECALFGAGPEPEFCDNAAEYLFVYDSNLVDGGRDRQNALACDGCFTPPVKHEPVADGGLEETHISDEGLWIPPELREFTSQIVFRTPRGTIQHFQSGGDDLGAYYGLIDESHFGEPETMRDAKNPDLAPDRVSIKPQGEEAVELVVDLDGEKPLAADGGTQWSDLIAIQRDVLEAIQRLDNLGEPVYGLAIKRTLEEDYAEEVNRGRLYPNLDELVERGLLTKGELDQRTNEYHLTDAGEQLLRARTRRLMQTTGVRTPAADGGGR